MTRQALLMSIHQAMLDQLGPSGWWPGETPFEVAVGAILTQNTSWKNVAKAIDNLKAAGRLTPEALHELPAEEIAALIRPAGYYNLKARRLKDFLGFLETSCGLDLDKLKTLELPEVRDMLLGVRGIGPETADSILLYALEFPIFVTDAYTFRILSRHGLVPEDAGYAEIQDFFMDVLDPDPVLFNEYHALLVRVGAGFCKKTTPLCDACPLGRFLE